MTTAMQVKLIHLHDNQSKSLSVGSPTTIEESLRLTIADDQGNAILERLTASSCGNVHVAGAPVFELAHCRPLQLIETSGGAYVFLRPYDVYLRGDHEPHHRLTRWQQLQCRVDLTPLNYLFAGFTAPASPQTSSSSKPRDQRERLTLLTMVLIVGVLAAWRIAQTTPVTPETVMTADEAAAIEAPIEPIKESTPLVQKTPVHPAPKKSVAPKPAAQPKRVSQSFQPPTKITPPPARSLAPATEQRIRQRLEALLLEANYDPHGSKKQLRALSQSAPQGSAIHRDIERAISTIQ